MSDPSENYLGVFNEFTIQVYLYLMMALTEYNGPNPFRAEFGLGLVSVIIISLLINIMKFLVSLVKAIYMKCKKFKAFKKG
jgi:hypothetical protein